MNSNAALTDDQRAAVAAALTSPDLRLIKGRGDAIEPGTGEACTISEIVLTLTGRLDDGRHPCISEVIRCWVIRIQDEMPDSIRNSMAWREAAVGIAGSAAGVDVERRRVAFLLEWMWDALGDEAVLAALPSSMVSSWRSMLALRTSAAAVSASVAVSASAAVAAVSYAASAARLYHRCADSASSGSAADAVALAADVAAYHSSAADADSAYWERRDMPGTLAALIAIS